MKLLYYKNKFYVVIKDSCTKSSQSGIKIGSKSFWKSITVKDVNHSLRLIEWLMVNVYEK